LIGIVEGALLQRAGSYACLLTHSTVADTSRRYQEETTMKIDPATIAAVITAFSEIPVRVAGMERAVTEVTASVEALRAASPPLLLRLPEAAAIFKMSVVTMRRWVKTGHVPVVKVANTVRVDLTRVHGVDATDVARMAREVRGLGQLPPPCGRRRRPACGPRRLVNHIWAAACATNKGR
jgi:hypothetical protein